MTDPFVGQLTFFRVYSGTLESGIVRLQLDQGQEASASAVFCRCTPTSAKRSRKCAPATSARPSACETSRTGDTLCDENQPIVLETMDFPEPVIAVAIEPKTKADQDKLGVALAKLAAGRSDLPVHTDEETGQTIIAGMGELHLEIIVDRMKREFKVDANVGKPQVAYRETITQERRRPRASSSARRAARASTATS